MKDLEQTRDEPTSPPLFGSSRLCIAILGCFGVVQAYASVVNMSVAIVCMVNKTSPLINCSLQNDSRLSECSLSQSGDDENDNTGKFSWDSKIQGYILGAFYWGYLVSQIPAGWLATRFGGKRVLGFSILVGSGITLLTPLAANTSYILLIILRITLGVFGGALYPSSHVMLSYWAPPLERSKLAAITFSGLQISLVITFPIGGLLCKYGFAGGWPSLFYVCGISGFVWFILWMLIVSDTPESHKRISPQEREYIMKSLVSGAHTSSKKDPRVPWLQILKSMPNYAIIVANVGFDWAVYVFITYTPTYMDDVLQFDITSNGLISALPYIVYWVIIIFSGWLADTCQRRKLMSTTVTRKLFAAAGGIVPAAMLIGLGYVDGSSQSLAVALLTLAISTVGFQYSGFVVNHVDIAPYYAGVLFAISNTVAAVTGFVSPVVVGEITKEAQTRVEWQKVFYITAAILVFCVLFFVIFGTGELQPWALESIKTREIEVTVNDEKSDNNKLNNNANSFINAAFDNINDNHNENQETLQYTTKL